MPERPPLQLRPAEAADLPRLNAVIEAAVMQWQLPERVKRLALSSYRYDEHDLSHLELVVAETEGAITGIAAWEPAGPGDAPDAKRALLLHGLYVHPEAQHQGIGTRLFQAAEQQVKSRRLDGLLVKAQSDAKPFFLARKMRLLPSTDPSRDYHHRLWKPIESIE